MNAIKLTAMFFVFHAAVSVAPARAQAPAAPEPSAAPVQQEPTPAVPPAAAPQAVDSQAPERPPTRTLHQELPADEAAPRSSGLLFLPSVGIHSFQNDSARAYDAGFRMGSLLGGRVNQFVSINGEAALDIMNPTGVPAGLNVSAMQLHAAFSPLAHARTGNLELVVGPKLGLFLIDIDVTGNGNEASSTARGWMYGLNIGMFGALTDTVSLGGRLSFDFQTVTTACISGTGVSETCQSPDDDETLKVLGVGLAMLM
jgi:hypothetical protein